MTKIQVTLSRHDDNRGVSKWGLLVKKYYQILFRSTSLPDCAMQAGTRCSFRFYKNKILSGTTALSDRNDSLTNN